MNCVDVIVPGPWWNTLTYLVGSGFGELSSTLSATLSSPPVPAEGVRVRVPLGKGTRVGFVKGAVYSAPLGIKRLRPILDVLDGVSVLGDELWSLANWIGNTFLCGAGEALQLICPAQVLRGEPIGCETFRYALTPLDLNCKSFHEVPANVNDCVQNDRAQSDCAQNNEPCFREVSFYNPVDEERFAHYRGVLSDMFSTGEKRALLLFPEAKMAGAFFARMPKQFKADALLWPSSGGKKLWDAWKKTASGEVRLVVGSSGAAFAPFRFDEAIVDDESNLAYIFQRPPRISARSLVGRRALTLKAKLLLGGRMPSARTYMRSRPECGAPPRQSGLVFVDIRRSFKNEVRGVEGGLPVTPSLLERTESALSSGRHAFWIMDRKGQAGEVYCFDCGSSLCCPRCKGVMRSESSGGAAGLRCVRCGARGPLPPRCPVCRGSLLLGKRPGLEALLPMAARFMKGRQVLLDEAGEAGLKNRKSLSGPAVILGTRKLLSLCDSLDAGMIAWLDLDAEARKADYNAKFQAFSMVWESCWRGLPKDGERVVLMQVRGSGNSWRNVLRLGWGHFWKGELLEREQLGLPPCGLLIQVDLPKNEDKKALIDSLDRENIAAMDSGEESSSLWVSAKSTEKLKAALAPRFEISRSSAGFPVVTVWAE